MNVPKVNTITEQSFQIEKNLKSDDNCSRHRTLPVIKFAGKIYVDLSRFFMKNTNDYAQFYLRLAIGLGFIFAVLDRLGLAGAAGQPNIAWGNWTSFLDYTHVLLPLLPKGLSDASGWVATIAEAVFGLMLIIGYKTRLAAIGSGALMLVFAVAMMITLGYKAPFNYSVFAGSAGAFLLSTVQKYRWSLDG